MEDVPETGSLRIPVNRWGKTVCAQAIKCSLMPACPICACYVPNCGKRRAGQKPQSPVAVRKPSSLKRERAFARKGKHPVVGIQGVSSEDFIERIVHDAIREFPFRLIPHFPPPCTIQDLAIPGRTASMTLFHAQFG